MHKLKYPKLLVLLLTFVLAYELFIFLNAARFTTLISSWGYIGTFIAGILFSYGFTAAPATALFLVLGHQQTWWIASIIGALGSVCGNLLVFNVIRYSVDDELKRLERTKSVRQFERAVPRRLKHFIVPVLAGFIMASPLPDEAAMSLFALARHISHLELILVSFVLHFLGIAALIGLGNLL